MGTSIHKPPSSTQVGLEDQQERSSEEFSPWHQGKKKKYYVSPFFNDLKNHLQMVYSYLPGLMGNLTSFFSCNPSLSLSAHTSLTIPKCHKPQGSYSPKKLREHPFPSPSPICNHCHPQCSFLRPLVNTALSCWSGPVATSRGSDIRFATAIQASSGPTQSHHSPY